MHPLDEMRAIWNVPPELNNEITGAGKQARNSWRSADRLQDEPGVASSRIAKAIATEILAVRMFAKA